MKRLGEIPGVGPMIASALVAAIGDGKTFGRGRDLSAWLGLVPRQVSTDGKAKLIGISKRGNRYLRKLFIHAARTVLYLVKDRSTPLARWIDQLKLAPPWQRCGGRDGKQAGADCPGCADQEGTIRPSRSPRCLIGEEGQRHD